MDTESHITVLVTPYLLDTVGNLVYFQGITSYLNKEYLEQLESLAYKNMTLDEAGEIAPKSLKTTYIEAVNNILSDKKLCVLYAPIAAKALPVPALLKTSGWAMIGKSFCIENRLHFGINISAVQSPAISGCRPLQSFKADITVHEYRSGNNDLNVEKILEVLKVTAESINDITAKAHFEKLDNNITTVEELLSRLEIFKLAENNPENIIRPYRKMVETLAPKEPKTLTEFVKVI